MPRHHEDEREDQSFSLAFGGGVNLRKSPEEIEPVEATLLQNVDIDIDRNTLTSRPELHRFPYFSAGLGANVTETQAPNGQTITGFVQLVTPQEGDTQTQRVSTLIQAGTHLYRIIQRTDTPSNPIRWHTIRDNLPVGCKLRGHLHSNSQLDGVAIITDLSLQEPVMVWDGTTLSNLAHELHLQDPNNLWEASGFYAKYCVVEGERAWFANVRTILARGTGDNSEVEDVYVPHMIVASEVSDITNLSTANKPSSALGAADPFFLLTPDLKPVNGMVPVFGTMVFSSYQGRMYQLSGFSSQNFAVDAFFSGSSAGGDEGMVLAGNDIFYVNNYGNVESLAGVQAFGDVEVDNISRPLEKAINSQFKASRCVYNPSSYKLFVQAEMALLSPLVFGSGPIELDEQFYGTGAWVFSKSIHDQQAKDVSLLRQGTPVSPWCYWQELDGAAPPVIPGVSERRSLKTETMWVMYPLFSSQAGAAAPIVDPVLPEGQQLATFFGGASGYCYFIEERQDWSRYGDFGEPPTGKDGTVSDNDIVLRFLSKSVTAPSKKGFADVRAQVRYLVGTAPATPVNESYVPPEVTLTLYLQGKIAQQHSVTFSLSQPDSFPEGTPPVVQLTKNVDLPSLDQADRMQIGLRIENRNKLVQLLGIDFNVRA